MVWRVGGLLVVSGLAFDLVLSGAFVVIGFSCMLAGVITLALHLETSLLGDGLAARPMPATEPDEVPANAGV